MGIIVYHKRRLYRRFWKKLPSHRWLHAKSYVPRRYIVFTKGKLSMYKIRTPRKRFFKRIVDPMGYLRSFKYSNFFLKSRGRRTTPTSPTIKQSKKIKTVKGSQSQTKKGARAKTGKKKHPKSAEYEYFKDIWKTKKYQENFSKKFNEKLAASKYSEEMRARRGAVSSFGNVRYDGKNWKENWGGWERTLKYDQNGILRNPRKYKNYGATGNFDLVTVFDMHIKYDAYMAFLMHMRSIGADMEKLKADIKKEIEDLRKRIVYRGIQVIRTIVPIDTGDLQRSMENTVAEERSFPTNVLIKIGTPPIAGNDLEYAKVVNRYPDWKVKHYGDRISWRTGEPLYDPDALHNYFGETVKELRHIAKREYQIFLTNIFKAATVKKYKTSGFIKRPIDEIRKQERDLQRLDEMIADFGRPEVVGGKVVVDEIKIVREAALKKLLRDKVRYMEDRLALEREDREYEVKLRRLWTKKATQDPIRAIIEPDITMIREIWEVKYK